MTKHFGIGSLVFMSCVSVILVITVFYGSYTIFHERAEYHRQTVESGLPVSSGPGEVPVPHGNSQVELKGYLTGIVAGIVFAVVISLLFSFLIRREFVIFGRSFERATERLEPVVTNRLSLAEFHDLAERVSLVIEERRAAAEAHRESEDRFASVFHAGPIAAIIMEGETREIVEVNDILTRQFGYAREDLIGKSIDYFSPWVNDDMRDAVRRELAVEGRILNREAEFRIKSGETRKVLISMEHLKMGGKSSVIALLNDVTELERTRGELIESGQKYSLLIEHMDNAFANHRIVLDGNGVPVDYIFEEVNEAFERMTGLDRRSIIGRRVSEVIPGMREDKFDWIGYYGRVARTGEPARFEQYFEPFGKWYAVSIYSPAPGCFATNFFDITDRKKTEEDMRARMAEIEHFNRLTTSRELRVIELKKKVNELAVRLGEASPLKEKDDDDAQLPFGEPPGSAVEHEGENQTRISLENILDRERMRNLLDSFCDAMGISAAILDTAGNILVGARWRRICTGFHRVDERTRARCRESDTILASRQERGGKYSIYRCRNGLTDAATPIVVGGRHVGNVFVGQFLTEPPDVEFFRGQAREMGFDERDYLDALAEIPVIPEEKLAPILDFMTGLASMTGQMGLEHIHENARREDLLRRNDEMDRFNRELVRQRKAAISLADDANEARMLFEESERRFRVLTEHALAGTYIIQDGVFRYVNPALARMVGCGTDALLGTNPMEVIHPEDRPYVTDNLRRRLLGEHVPNRYEFRGMRKNGEEIRLEVIADMVEYEGRPAVLGNLIDITGRKEAENALRSAKEYAENLIATANAMVVGLDIDGCITVFNRAAEEITGYTKEELAGRNWFEIVVPRNRFPEVWMVFERLGAGKIPRNFENPILTKSGEERYIVWQNNEVREGENIIGTVSFGIDITQRKSAEEALSLSHFSIERSKDAMFRVASDGRFLNVNEAACRMLEYTREELLSMSVSDIDPTFPPERWVQHWEEILVKKSFTFETVHRAKSGREFPVDMSVNYFEYMGAGYNFAYARDITDRVRAREALTSEKERLAVTLRSIGDGVITTDREGRVALVNRVAEDLTGWAQQEAEGRYIGEVFRLLDEKTRAPIENPAMRALSEGSVVELAAPALLVARDGREIAVADSGAPIRDARSRIVGMVIVFRDVTERRKMEEEVLKTQKLEAVGVLAGGIAHDFNNILTGILGALSVARITIGEGSEAMETIAEAERESLKARELTSQLLTFSKGGEPVRATVSIDEMVTETVRFVLRGSSVKGVFDFQKNLRAARVDLSQLSRVMNNLAINAVQAMPGGGMLKVTARNVTVGKDDPLPLEPGDYIRLDIRDTGVGVPREHLAKIFDPYFTTKEKGSGLGLATTYSIIHRHQGHITVESEEGKGTVFHIHLPAADVVADKGPEKAGYVAEAGTGRILVMDDEKSVRNIAIKIGVLLGYEIETAEDGDMAVAMFREARESGRPYNAVVMDLTVPGGMGGKDAADVLLTLAPETKIVVSSGYSTDPIMSEYERYGFSGVLVKPYRVEEFARVIRNVMQLP